MPFVDPVLRVRRLALDAQLRAGGSPRLAQMVRAWLVRPAVEIAGPRPPAAAPPPIGESLVEAYCAAVGVPVPSWVERAKHAERDRFGNLLGAKR